LSGLCTIALLTAWRFAFSRTPGKLSPNPVPSFKILPDQVWLTQDTLRYKFILGVMSHPILRPFTHSKGGDFMGRKNPGGSSLKSLPATGESQGRRLSQW
jgi:hypothetical protein